MTNTHSYRITNDIDHYFAGYLSNGNQVLMGIQMPEVVMIEFDSAGSYLTTSSRIPAMQDPSGNAKSEEMRRLSAKAIIEWQREIGFTPETISIRRFFLTERRIGIKDLPDHFQDVLNTPESYPKEELQDLTEDILLWRASGDFVLCFTEDYYLNEAGNLVSS